MRLLWPLLLAACSRGYREPGDSDDVTRRIEDSNIASRVRIVLGEDPQTAAHDSIRVRCVDGVVTLTGAVDRHAVKDRARELAAGCRGVRRVVDRLSVRSASSSR